VSHTTGRTPPHGTAASLLHALVARTRRVEMMTPRARARISHLFSSGCFEKHRQQHAPDRARSVPAL